MVWCWNSSVWHYLELPWLMIYTLRNVTEKLIMINLNFKTSRIWSKSAGRKQSKVCCWLKTRLFFSQNRLNTQSLQTNILDDPYNDEIVFFNFLELHIRKKLIFSRGRDEWSQQLFFNLAKSTLFYQRHKDFYYYVRKKTNKVVYIRYWLSLFELWRARFSLLRKLGVL